MVFEIIIKFLNTLCIPFNLKKTRFLLNITISYSYFFFFLKNKNTRTHTEKKILYKKNQKNERARVEIDLYTCCSIYKQNSHTYIFFYFIQIYKMKAFFCCFLIFIINIQHKKKKKPKITDETMTYIIYTF
jgi:hypothetical protein